MGFMLSAPAYAAHSKESKEAKEAKSRTNTPLRLVALGDSIVWGQGLSVESKFVNIVTQRLPQIAGRVGKSENYAHSGATLMNEPSDPLKVLATANGEVPRSSNSIRTQLAAVTDPKTVDIVIVNGCINDVGSNSIVLPGRSSQSAWRSIATERCLAPMKTLLVEVLAKFPNARVVVPGYYPIFLPDDGKSSSLRLSTFGAIGNWVEDKIDDLSDSLLGKAIDSACGDDTKCEKTTSSKTLRAGLASRSRWWAEESSRALREAVDTVSRSNRTRKLAFAPVTFSSGDGVGQAHSKLWNPGEIDPRSSDRSVECKRAREKAPKLNFKRCVLASSFHPNTRGAKHYADAVETALRALLK